MYNIRHDVHVCVDGLAARDIAKSFVQRWNHHIGELNAPFPFLTPKTARPVKMLSPGGVTTREGKNY